MAEITVRPLTEDDWELYRSVRLAGLRTDPDAFAATLAEEEAFDEALWRERMNRSARLVAELEDEPTGIVSIGHATTDDHDLAAESERSRELFGLWVAPEQRGKGSATRLLRSAVDYARSAGGEFLVYWVGTDNGRAVGFASAHGFRPTDFRRPMKGAQATADDEEIAMVLPLVEDAGPHPRLS